MLKFSIALTRRIIGKFLPQKSKKKIWQLWRRIRVVKDSIHAYLHDLNRFLRWSGIWRKYSNRVQLRAIITANFHGIEKGLSLKNPRPGFGSGHVYDLVSGLEKYQEEYGSDETTRYAINALIAYYQFNLIQGTDDRKLYEQISKLAEKCGKHCSAGGAKQVTRDNIHRASKRDLTGFFESRHSIRQFAADVDVDLKEIEKAVRMAQQTPSACNRQAWKVYVFSKDEDKKRILSLQKGSRGFGDQASKILVITTDLGNFLSIEERNQAWVDGGMFAMSLVYALHSLGLGTCCLHWCVRCEVDQELKKFAGITDAELVPMLIAVGHLPDEFMVAQSPRRDIKDMLVFK